MSTVATQRAFAGEQSNRLLRSAAWLGLTAAGIRFASAWDGTPTGEALWLVVGGLLAVGMLLAVLGLTVAYAVEHAFPGRPARLRDGRGRFVAANPALRLADDTDRPLLEVVMAAERFAERHPAK